MTAKSKNTEPTPVVDEVAPEPVLVADEVIADVPEFSTQDIQADGPGAGGRS
jgi:hypothetical protein